jgi:RNA polymerase sigma-70 factor (ECF subfamily)
MSTTERREESESREKQRQFMELLLPLRDPLVRFARSMARTPEDAEDLVADTMLAAFERFDKVNNREAFLSYLFTIASRIHRQRTWRRRIFGAFSDAQAETLPHPGTSPEVSTDVVILREALRHLPERQRETLVLFELSGLSLEEIRQVQGGSLSGVKSRLTRGRERLADLLTATPSHVDSELTAAETAGTTGGADPSSQYSRPKSNG